MEIGSVCTSELNFIEKIIGVEFRLVCVFMGGLYINRTCDMLQMDGTVVLSVRHADCVNACMS